MGAEKKLGFAAGTFGLGAGVRRGNFTEYPGGGLRLARDLTPEAVALISHNMQPPDGKHFIGGRKQFIQDLRDALQETNTEVANWHNAILADNPEPPDEQVAADHKPPGVCSIL